MHFLRNMKLLVICCQTLTYSVAEASGGLFANRARPGTAQRNSLFVSARWAVDADGTSRVR